MTSCAEFGRFARRIITFAYAFASSNGGEGTIVFLNGIIGRLRGGRNLTCANPPGRSSFAAL